MRIFVSLALLFLAFTSARADQLIVNGGFELGSLSGWVVTTSTGGDGSFTVNSGPTTPLTYNATVGANSGTYYAVSDDYNGSQTQFLTQTFTTPTSLSTATLSFAMFVNDIYGNSGPGGQVSLLNALGGTIAILYGPIDTVENPTGSPNPYLLFSQDISRYLAAGTTYKLQFSSTDTAGLINVGIDDVSLVTSNVAATPEPSTLSLAALGGCLIFWLASKKARTMEA